MEHDDRQLSGDMPEGTACEVNLNAAETDGDTSEDCAFVSSGDIVVRDMPEVKLIEQLKNELGTMDIGSTIKDLFVSMQNMDAQLNSVLSINASIEKDIKISRDVITRLKDEKKQLEETIRILKEEVPSKMELKAEIEHLIEERNKAQVSIRSMKMLVEKTKDKMHGAESRISELENEKADLLKDINYLEIKCNAAMEKLNSYAKEITILKGEKLSNLEKIGDLRAQYKKCVEEKNKLLVQKLS